MVLMALRRRAQLGLELQDIGFEALMLEAEKIQPQVVLPLPFPGLGYMPLC